MSTLHTLYVSHLPGPPLPPPPRRASTTYIEDIAHGLAFQCRFNGQTRSFYSVAQHSLFVAALVPARLKPPPRCRRSRGLPRRHGQTAEGALPEFSRMSRAVMAVIGQRFGATGFDAPAIKRADLIALATEKARPHAELLRTVADALRHRPGAGAASSRWRRTSEGGVLERFRELAARGSGLIRPHQPR